MSFSNDERIVDTTDKTIAPKIAASQPSIVNPLTIAATINSTMAFSTKVKRPSVKKVNGSVIKLKTGFMNVLTTPNTILAKIADVKLAT